MPTTTKIRDSAFEIGTTAANAATDTYTEIGGAKAVGGNFGLSFAAIDATTLADSYRQEVKGLADAGAIDLAGNYDRTDPGIVKLAAAAAQDDDDTPFNFRWTAKNGERVIFKARVMSFTPSIGSPTNLYEYRSRLKLTAVHTATAA